MIDMSAKFDEEAQSVAHTCTDRQLHGTTVVLLYPLRNAAQG